MGITAHPNGLPAGSELDLDTSALDCIQANLAAVGSLLHDRSLTHRLGAALAFRPRPSREGPALPTAEPSTEAQLASAEDLLGLRKSDPRSHPDARALTGSLGPDWTFVLADAYELGWVPYYRQEHNEHSFALRAVGDRVELLDAYTNDTPWGSARPKLWRLTPGQLRAALPAAPATAVTLRAAAAPAEQQPRAVLERVAADLAAAARDGRVEDYLQAYAAHPDRVAAITKFTVETWLLARQRVAFARWLDRPAADGTRAVDARPALERGERWLEASEATYLAMRRVQRGRPAPDGVIERVADLLGTDGAVLRGCHDSLGVSS